MRLQTRFLSYFAALAAVIVALAVLLVDEAMDDVLMGPAPRRLMRLALIAIALVAVGFGAAGSYVLARRITRLLSLLAAGTQRTAAGDLESRLELRTGDEMEELARSFEGMIGQIRATRGPSRS